MTTTIHRFQLYANGGDQTIDAAWQGPILRVAAVSDQLIDIWAEVDPDRPTHSRTFTVVGTGYPIPGRFIPVGTTERTLSGLVWHVLQEGR